MSHEIALIQIIGVLQTSTIGDAFSSAFGTFLTEVFAFIPNIIAALLTLLVGYIFVKFVVKGIRLGMQKANVDKPIAKTELGQFLERSGQTFSGLVASSVRILLIIVVAVYAISVLNIAPLTASMMGILAWIPNLVGAAIIVVVGALIASFAGRAVGDNLPRYGVGGGRVIGLALKLLIYALVFDFAIIQLGFGQGIIYTTTTALAWGLAAALAIGLGVPIAYSLKGVMTSMATGATTIASTLKEGQQITVDGIENAGDRGRVTGTIRSVGMFNTVIEGGGNGSGRAYLILPNSLLVDRPIMVDSRDVPKLWDDGVRDKMSQLDNKIDGHNNGGPQSVKNEEVPVMARN